MAAAASVARWLSRIGQSHREPSMSHGAPLARMVALMVALEPMDFIPIGPFFESRAFEDASEFSSSHIRGGLARGQISS